MLPSPGRPPRLCSPCAPLILQTPVPGLQPGTGVPLAPPILWGFSARREEPRATSAVSPAGSRPAPQGGLSPPQLPEPGSPGPVPRGRALPGVCCALGNLGNLDGDAGGAPGVGRALSPAVKPAVESAAARSRARRWLLPPASCRCRPGGGGAGGADPTPCVGGGREALDRQAMGQPSAAAWALRRL